MIRRILRFAWAYLAIGLILCAYLWAAGNVYSRKTHQAPINKKVIRIGHHQLEAGVREAIDTLGAEYVKSHPDVEILQEAVPDGVYGQWISTQLIGGNPPDLLQVEGALLLPWNVWLSFIERYFMPVTAYVNNANPYNVGTELEDVPFRQTFKDGMRTTFSGHIIEYYAVSLSRFAFRVFYNKTLLKELTGRDEPPRTYREFVEVCKIVTEQQDAQGRTYIPIANSKSHMPMWEGMADPLTYPLVELADFNRDGGLLPQELWVAVKSGRASLNHPAFRARFRMLREIAQFSQPGYTGLNRDEAVFLFIQQRAVFISGGTYEAHSLANMAEDQFELGVMPLPRPTKDDPVYGEFVYGPVCEESLVAIPTGLQLGITYASQHPDVALDFLMFLTSRKGNEELNKIIGWLPIIKGAQTDELLGKFEPNVEGISGYVSTPILIMGSETNIKLTQLYSLYQLGELSLDDFLAQYEAFYVKEGGLDFREQLSQFTDNCERSEEFLTTIRSLALAANGQEAQSQWGRYWQLLWQSQILVEIVSEQLEELIDGGPTLDADMPYGYSQFALDRVRRHVQEELAKDNGAATSPVEHRTGP